MINLIELIGQRYPKYSKKELYARVICGKIKVNGETTRDSRKKVDPCSVVEIIEKRFVSRGGEKLDKVLADWKIDVTGKVVLDAGCSTGGFTDCLLSRGADLVHAVDVGYNQVAFSLRANKKVLLHEKTNINSLVKLEPPPHLAVADLSFRSILGVAGKLIKLTRDNQLIALVKPQFEWQNPGADFNGVVKSHRDYQEILKKTLVNLWQNKAYVKDIDVSCLPGRKGNKEFFFFMSDQPSMNFEAALFRVSEILRPLF